MLKECLANIDVENDVPFERNGIVIFSNATKQQYCIMFGNDNLYDLYDSKEVEAIKASGNDGYVAVEVDTVNDDGSCNEGDWGCRCFYRRDKFTGLLNDYDFIKYILDEVKCSDVDDCFVMSKF